MTLQENTDYAFTLVADQIMEKIYFVGTKTYLYVPDQKMVAESSIKEILVNAFAGADKVESFNFGDNTSREIIAELLATNETTLESSDKFFKNFHEE